MRAALLLAGLIAAAAARAAGEDPAQLMAQLEARLLAAKRVTIEARIESRGAVDSSLSGRTELRGRNHASLAYAGAFAGANADLALESDGLALVLRRGTERRQDTAPAELNRALLIGLLRMGSLHNLARLTGLQAPDHASGGVETWVALDSFHPTTFPQGEALTGSMAFGYDLRVAGTPSASGRLWLDARTGLPRQRQLTVRFGDAEMDVVETYTRFEVE